MGFFFHRYLPGFGQRRSICVTDFALAQPGIWHRVQLKEVGWLVLIMAERIFPIPNGDTYFSPGLPE